MREGMEAKPVELEYGSTMLIAIRSLCRLFWGPNPQDCRQIHSGEWFAPFETIAASRRKNGLQAFDAQARMRVVAADCASPDKFCEDLETCYVQTFISNKGGIAASLYQSSYESENRSLMGPAALRMKDRLEAAGLAMTEDRAEPPDHLAIQLEYLYFLLAEGFAGSPEYMAEAADFVETEMIPWVAAMRDRLMAGSVLFYGLAAELLLDLFEVIAADLQPAVRE